MTNREKFADEIFSVLCEDGRIAVDKSGRVRNCSTTDCAKCIFCKGNSYNFTFKAWGNAEYIERPKISKKDRGFLEYIPDKYKYIARDKSGNLFIYTSKPRKTIYYSVWSSWDEQSSIEWLDVDFPMVKWSDEEPWSIEGLKKLEVVEDYE